ncbi:MAG TPA: DUF6263 family protein [Gemmatimonadaceae bacterium]|nr:DUF6263 family protein [Gemmatimonadaceae bacterium]
MTGRSLWCLLTLGAMAMSGGAQDVVLELRPRAGDTVAVRLEHRVEMTGTRRIGGRDSVTRVASSMLTLGRTVVESVSPAYAIVATHTDSVALESSNDGDGSMKEDARRALRGAVTRVRILPDGTAEPVEDGSGTPRAAWLAVMPGTLPREPVAVGSRWTRTMPIPNADGRAVGSGQVRATFRLDSLSANGRYAWISMRGTMRRDSNAAAPNTTRSGSLNGTMSGALKLDRKRGWVVDSVTDMTVRSVVPTPGAPDSPMRVTVRMFQHMSASGHD